MRPRSESMMPRPRPRALLSILFTLGLAGCGDKTGATASGGGSGTDATTTGTSTSTTVPTSSTDPGTTGGTTTSASGTTTSTGTTGPTSTAPFDSSGSGTTTGDGTTGECVQMPLPDTSTTSTSSTTDGGPCNDLPGQPQDAECTDPSGCGCASGKCFVIPALGGFCGECLDDDDCPGGCTIPNPVAGVGATCNAGGPGDGCNTDAACLNTCAPKCALVLSVPGIIQASTCSQCASNADCGGTRPNCTPEYDIPNFSGQLVCKPDGSVPDDGGCSLVDDGMGGVQGDKACQSGHCGEASVMGLLKLGICGACNADADCPNGQLCTDPMVDLNLGDLIGSECL